MGLDSVELVIKVEQHFDLEIANEDAEKLTTVGELHAYVFAKLQRRSPGLVGSAQVFDEIRAIVVEQTGVDPQLVVPEASFVDDLGID